MMKLSNRISSKAELINQSEFYGFDKISKDCREFVRFTNEKNVLKEKIIELVKPKSHHLVLDIGCGEGFFLEKVAPLVKQVIGIDPDPKMIEKIRKKISYKDKINIIQKKFEEHYFDEKFDVVNATHVFSFFENKINVLEKMINITKDNGTIILVLHSKNSDQMSILNQFNKKLGKKLHHTTIENIFNTMQYKGIKGKLEQLETEINIPAFDKVVDLSYFLFRIQRQNITPEMREVIKGILKPYMTPNGFKLKTKHGIISIRKK